MARKTRTVAAPEKVLSPKAGAKLLKSLGVKGPESDLLAASQEVSRVIATYATWLREGPEAVILRMLGLFDGPAPPEAIDALRAKPAVPWLTEPLMDLREEDWQRALSNLREYGLLLPDDPQRPGMLDVHPLVRAYFREYLKSEQPEGWQAGNLRLRELLRKQTPD